MRVTFTKTGERSYAIAQGVFGQLAAGGDVGTFFTIPHRRRDRTGRLSARLAAIGREDTARSERLAAARLAAWHARRRDAVEPTAIPDALLDELDEVATRWHGLRVGEAMALSWPAHLTIHPAGSAHGRRRSRDRGLTVRGR